MKASTFLLVAAVCVAASGCSCLKSTTVGGEITPVNEAKIKLGAIKPEVTFEFKECCPSKNDTDNLDKVKGMSTDLLNKYLQGEISKDDYNEKILAINSVMSQIQNQCSVKKNAPGAVSGDPWQKLDAFVKAQG